MIPQDPFLLVSYVNTALRDGPLTLAEFCAAEDLSEEELKEKLAAVGFYYRAEQNRFV